MGLYILYKQKHNQFYFANIYFSNFIIANFMQIEKRKIIKIAAGKPDAGNVTEKSRYLENASCSAI